MNKMLDWYEEPYADDDALLNEFIERHLRRLSWGLFENQQDILYMADETDNDIPKMREGAIDYIRGKARLELSWLIEYMIDRTLISYLKENIEPSEEVKEWFRTGMSEEDYEQLWVDIDDYIWNDYAGALGEARTAELWEKWGKKPREE